MERARHLQLRGQFRLARLGGLGFPINSVVETGGPHGRPSRRRV